MAIFIQSNFRENRLFANEWHLMSKKGSHNVKFCAENFTHPPMARSEIYPELVVRLLITGCLLFSLLLVRLSFACWHLACLILLAQCTAPSQILQGMGSTKHTFKTVQTTTLGLSFTALQSRNDVREVLCFGGIEKKKADRL